MKTAGGLLRNRKVMRKLGRRMLARSQVTFWIRGGGRTSKGVRGFRILERGIDSILRVPVSLGLRVQDLGVRGLGLGLRV